MSTQEKTLAFVYGKIGQDVGHHQRPGTLTILVKKVLMAHLIGVLPQFGGKIFQTLLMAFGAWISGAKLTLFQKVVIGILLVKYWYGLATARYPYQTQDSSL